MKYVVYELQFNTAIHFGNGRLDDTEYVVYADTIFSALCHELLLQSQESFEQIVTAVQKNELRISDSMPFYRHTYFVPKPILHIQESVKTDFSQRKKYKKLQYLPVSEIEIFLKGKLDTDKINTDIGVTTIRTMGRINEGKETRPYSVGTFQFNKDWGLYVIVGYEDNKIREIIENTFVSLGLNGIGGKRSAGLGKFELGFGKPKEEFLHRLTIDNRNSKYMSLSICCPESAAIDKVFKGASYAVLKRTGFISSSMYSSTFMKKEEFYAMRGGSVFDTAFNGVLQDVSAHGKHPVYRYAKPIFLEI